MAAPHPSTQFKAPSSIQKGSCLSDLYSAHTIWLIGESFKDVVEGFKIKAFRKDAEDESQGLPFKEKTASIGKVLRRYLPADEMTALNALSDSLGPKLNQTENNGLRVMFYMPHSHVLKGFASTGDKELFDRAVGVNFALTSRFTAEFSIRPFLKARLDRCLKLLSERISDPDPHIRRLISEGTRPRLPWAGHLYDIREDPSFTMPLLEALKTDDCRYVTRSVANHLGDIGKDHRDLLLNTCERWTLISESKGLSIESAKELRWIVRHALRHPAKKGDRIALNLRMRAK
jgi:3-methyladenine DNA glycosylase AlkC